MNLKPEIREEDLHAYIDGELDAAERARIESLVEGNGWLRDRVARYRADKSRLVGLYGGGMSEPLPQEWLDTIEAATTRRRWTAQSLGIAAMAASFVILFVGLVAWRFVGVMQPASGDIVADALAARAGTPAPVSVVPAETKALTQEARVMTAVLDARVKAPDLSRLGYHLVDINVYDAPKRAFELRYAARDGQIFTLYLRHSSGQPRFDQFKQDGMRVCVWQDDVVGMVMAGTMSVAEMQRLASLAYVGLET
jgi:anti-sigma factor RsiW